MERETVMKFFCSFCGQKTLIPEKMQPLGKKKKCRACGQVFEMSEQTMVRRNKKSSGQLRKMRKQQQQQNLGQSANTLKCYFCNYDLPIDPYHQKTHYNCPQCHSIVENPQAQSFPLGTVMLVVFVIITLLFIVVYQLGRGILKFSESFTADNAQTTNPKNDQPTGKNAPDHPNSDRTATSDKMTDQERRQLAGKQKQVQNLFDVIQANIRHRRLPASFRSLRELEAFCRRLPNQAGENYRRRLPQIENQLFNTTLSLLAEDRRRLLSCLQNRTLLPHLTSVSWMGEAQFLAWLEQKQPGISQQIAEVHQRYQESLQQHTLARNLCEAIQNSLGQKQLLRAWQTFDNFPDNCKVLYCNRTITYQQRLDEFQHQIILLARQAIDSGRQKLRHALLRNIHLNDCDPRLKSWNSEDRFLQWLKQSSPELKKLHDEYQKLELAYQGRFAGSTSKRDEQMQARKQWRQIATMVSRKQLLQAWEACQSFPEKWKDWNTIGRTGTYRQQLAGFESQLMTQAVLILQQDCSALKQELRKIKSSHYIPHWSSQQMASLAWEKGNFLPQLLKQRLDIADLWRQRQQALDEYNTVFREWKNKHLPAQFTLQVKDHQGQPCSNCRYRLFSLETQQDKLQMREKFRADKYDSLSNWSKLTKEKINQKHGGKYALAVQTRFGMLWRDIVLQADQPAQIELSAKKPGSVMCYYYYERTPRGYFPAQVVIRLIQDGLVYGIAKVSGRNTGNSESNITIPAMQPGKYTMVAGFYLHDGWHYLIKDNLKVRPDGKAKVRFPKNIKALSGVTLHFYDSKTRRPIPLRNRYQLSSALLLHNQDYVVAMIKEIRNNKEKILSHVYRHIPDGRYRVWVSLPGYHEVTKKVMAYRGWNKTNHQGQRGLQFAVTKILLKPVK